MTAAWKVRLPQSDKLLLLALADNANDQGLCWPSVQTLSQKCGLDDRTIQRAIKRLTDADHLTVNHRTGRSSYYTVHPRQDVTPVTSTPPSRCHPTPVTVPPHPRHGATQNLQGTIKEPSKKVEPRAARAPTATRLPADFSLTEEMRRYANQQGLQNVEGLFEGFTDHWRAESGAKARKHDWLAAWRTWCRRTAEGHGLRKYSQPVKTQSAWQPPPDDAECR